MRRKFYVGLLIVLLTNFAGGSAAEAAPPQEEENVRGAFLTSRPSEGGGRRPAAATTTRPNTTRPKNRVKTPAANNQTPASNSHSPTNTNQPSALTANPPSANAAHTLTNSVIGLGYTIYMRDPVGDAVRVDPTSQFRAGDRIRLVLEPNIDGYLYVFHTENDGAPQMLFPDVRLDGGANNVRAHVPYEVPSSREADERFRWFVFDQKPARERLYVFVSREPLPGVPNGDSLAAFCRAQQNNPCLWRPSAEQWAQIKTGPDNRVQMSKSRTYGQAQTSGERQATTRGIGLSQTAPEPSVVHMNASSSAKVLGTTVDLVHQ